MFSLENAQSLLNQIAFAARCGVTVEALERGYVRMRMPFGPNGNHIGTMYAGAQFTLAELPGGLIALSSFDMSRFFPIVKAMNIEFKRPASGDLITEVRLAEADIQAIEAQARSAGKADYGWLCELKDESGEVVAQSQNLYQLRRR